LGRRERTTAEVARRLKHDGFDTEAVERTLATLHEDGSLDDRRFARIFAEDKRTFEQWGSERIRRGLIGRGIDPETVAEVLDAAGGPDVDASQTEQERALALLHRRFPDPPRSRRDRDRALGVLLRKGYEPELALQTLSAYSRQ
jgi:regulatory protein